MTVARLAAEDHRGSPRGGLVGREAELAAVEHTLATHSRAWLSGLGGVGKSAVAMQVLARRGGAWVSLGSVRDPVAVGASIGAAVGFPPDATPAPSAVASWCASRSVTLLVLDDVDGVAEEVRRYAEVVSLRIPVLVTARAAIDAPFGLGLGPLDAASDGAALLLARAPDVRVDSELDPVLAREVAGLLGGLPLAIELAAAHLAVIPLARLADSLAGSPAALSDHRSMSGEATLRWSWDRLELDEARMLALCGVFAGSFPLSGLAAVAGAIEEEVLDPLHRLVRLHLVEPTREEGEPRFDLHPLVRRFARAELAARGDAEAVRAHAAWIGARARELVERVVALGTPAAYAVARREVVEARAAADRVEHAEPEDASSAAALVVLLEQRWSASFDVVVAAGRAGAGPSWSALLLARCSCRLKTDVAGALADATIGAEVSRAPVHRAAFRAQVAGARLALDASDRGAAAILHHEIAAGHGYPADSLLRRTRAIGLHLPRADEAAALADFEAAAAELRDRDPLAYAQTLHDMALPLTHLGRLDEAEARVVEAIDWFESVGLRHSAGVAMTRLAWCRALVGDLDRALELYGEAIPRMREAAESTSLSLQRVLPQLGLVLVERGLDVSRVEAELEPARTPPTWLSVRRQAFCVAALAAHARGDPAPPEPPDVGWAHGVSCALGILREVRASLSQDDRPAADAALETLGASLDGWTVAWGTRRVVLRILRRWAADLRSRARAWRVAADGSRFAPPCEAWVEVSRRPTVARLLSALSDGRAWSFEALGAVVWPGERMLGRSLRNRVQVTVSTLRRAGLVVVRKVDGGYRLDPEVPIERVPE